MSDFEMPKPFQGPLPKGWSPHDRYIMDRVIYERVSHESRTGRPWQPIASPQSSEPDLEKDRKSHLRRESAAIAASIGVDAFCRECFGTRMAHGDPCWRCDGTGVDAARSVHDHAVQFIGGIVTRYTEGR